MPLQRDDILNEDVWDSISFHGKRIEEIINPKDMEAIEKLLL